MLREAAIVLLLCTIAAEANRCKYRESRRPQALEIRRPRLCRGAGSFIGEDYWTSIGYDGQIREGRSRSDFLTFDQTTTGYIAYWITRTKYGNTHYEAFGHAFVRPDGRVCGWFVGLNRELVEVCGGFRVLSRNRYNPGEAIPFEWVQVNDYISPKNTLGFHEHRIAKFVGDNESFYGDARLQDRNFQGVSPSTESFTEVTSPSEFERRVWLLRRKADAPEPSNIRTGGGGFSDSRYPDPRIPDNRRYDPRYPDPRYRDFEHVRGDPRLDDPRFIDWLMKYDKAFANVTPNVWRYLKGEPQQPYAVGSGAAPHQTQDRTGGEGWQVQSPQEPQGRGEPLGDTGSQGLVPFGGPQPGFDGETGTGMGQGTQPGAQRLGDDYRRIDAYGKLIGGIRPSVGHGAQPGEVDSQGRPIGQGVQPEGVDAYGRPIGGGVQEQDTQGRPIGQGVHPSGLDGQGSPLEPRVLPEHGGQGGPAQSGSSDDQGRPVGDGFQASGAAGGWRPVGQGAQPGQVGRPIGHGAAVDAPGRPIGQGALPGQVDAYGRLIGEGGRPSEDGSVDQYGRPVGEQTGEVDGQGKPLGQGVHPGQGQVDAYGRPVGQGAQPSTGQGPANQYGRPVGGITGQVDGQGRPVGQGAHPSGVDAQGRPLGQGVQPGQGDAYGRPIGQGAVVDGHERPIGQGAQPGQVDAYGRPIGHVAQPSAGQGSVEQYGRLIGEPGQWRGSVNGRPVPGRSESYSFDAYGRPIDAQGRPLTDSQRTDPYGRPVDAYGRPLPVGAGVHPSQQQMADGRPAEPSQIGYPGVGRGAQPQSDTQTYAKVRPPTIIKDEYGTIYKQTVINGHTYFYADPHVQGKQVNVADTPADARLDSEQWRRQQEHMRRQEEERRLQEQRIRDQWAREGQHEEGQQPVEPRREEPRALEIPMAPEQPKQPEEPRQEPQGEISKAKEASENKDKPKETDEEKQETVEASGAEEKEMGEMEHEAEEPVPFEKEEPETHEQPEKLPPPKQTAEETEEDEDDQDA